MGNRQRGPINEVDNMNDSVLQGETVVDNIFGRDMLLTTLIQQGTWPFEWYIPQLGEMTQ